MSVKVVNGLIEEMCLSWRKCSEEVSVRDFGNFRAEMADKFYEEKGRYLGRAH